MEILGISISAIIGIACIGVLLLVGLFLLRMAFNITKSLLSLGCAVIVLIVVGLLILSWLIGI